MQKFTDLKVWQRAHAMTLNVYEVTRTFPRDEMFGMTSQLRRASVSIACNIAEGSKRRHRPDYARFLNLAEASAAEVEALLILAEDLGYLDPQKAASLMTAKNEVALMLHALRRAVETAERRHS